MMKKSLFVFFSLAVPPSFNSGILNKCLCLRNEGLLAALRLYRVYKTGYLYCNYGCHCDEGNTAGTFHPAFRQLVEGFLAKESLESQINKMYPNIKNFSPGFDHPCPTVAFVANAKCYNNMFGHSGKNRKYFENEYTRLNIRYMKDKDAGVSLADDEYLVLDLE